MSVDRAYWATRAQRVARYEAMLAVYDRCRAGVDRSSPTAAAELEAMRRLYRAMQEAEL